MDTFSFIKDYLLTYDYPLAHSMSEEEFADVFKISNRCFLISWMLKLLDNTYEEVLENCENDKEPLGNFLYELGFCTCKEKLLFMTGELPVVQQVKIISNIFTFITDLKKSKEDQEKVTMSSSELMALMNIDLNLFPMYGDIKLLKPPDRILKLSQLKEMADVKIDLSNNYEHLCLLDSSVKKEIEKFIETVKMNFPNIRSAIENVCKNSDVKSENVIQVNPNTVQILKKCSKNLKIITQFIKDIDTVENFEKQNNNIYVGNKGKGSVYDMIKMLQQDISTVLKYNRCL